MESKPAGGRYLTAGVTVLAIAMALYHLASTQVLFLSHVQHLNLHLFFALSIVFLQRIERNQKMWFFFALACLFAILLTGYIQFEADALMDREQAPTEMDTFVGVGLILLVLLATYLSYGPLLPIVSLIGIAYAFLGPYCPGPLFHGGVDFTRLVAMVTTDIDGIYGLLLYISATIMVILLTFGAFILTTGAAQFFIDFSLACAGRVKAGGGYSAVISSGLMGMASGSSVANVATTGTFTIPLMKRSGFQPHTAGGIEAAASCGGQIMPPVMGAGAFVMAEFTGIPYLKIIGYALIPATIYFVAVALNVYFRGRVMYLGSAPPEEIPTFWSVLPRFKFFIPIVVLAGVLIAQYSPSLAAFYAIICMILMIFPLRREALSPFLSAIWRGLEQGGRSAAEFATGMACIGIFVKVIVGTGVGLKLPYLVGQYAGGNLFLGYILTALASVVMGMGLPTIAAYIVVAVLAAPALVHMGADLIQAHFFVFYYSILSGLTPPVAVVAMVGAKLAKADFMKTCAMGIRFGLVAYLVPFLVVYNPALFGMGSLGATAAAVLGAFLGCLAASSCLQGYFFSSTTFLDRILVGIATYGFFGFAVSENFYLLGIALAIMVFVGWKQEGWDVIRRRMARVADRDV